MLGFQNCFQSYIRHLTASTVRFTDMLMKTKQNYVNCTRDDTAFTQLKTATRYKVRRNLYTLLSKMGGSHMEFLATLLVLQSAFILSNRIPMVELSQHASNLGVFCFLFGQLLFPRHLASGTYGNTTYRGFCEYNQRASFLPGCKTTI